MIVVRFENQALKEQAVELWHEAFGDNEDYIRFFLDTHGSCRCLTLTEGEELVSTLYLIDGELCARQGYYLFAAATFKKHRGKGYMASLLKKAEDFAKQNEKSFIALVPAEPSLFSYYSKFGYKTSFYARKQPVGAAFVTRGINVFCWSDGHTDYIRKEQEKYGTELYETDGMLFSVYEGGSIKTPAEKNEAYRYGMLLALDNAAIDLTEQNSYIGLTLE